MSPRKSTGRPAGRPPGPRRVMLLIRFDPVQAKGIRKIARRWQRERNAAQPDVSAVVRELVEQGLRRLRDAKARGLIP